MYTDIPNESSSFTFNALFVCVFGLFKLLFDDCCGNGPFFVSPLIFESIIFRSAGFRLCCEADLAPDGFLFRQLFIDRSASFSPIRFPVFGKKRTDQMKQSREINKILDRNQQNGEKNDESKPKEVYGT